jgi:hypothetical protein
MIATTTASAGTGTLTISGGGVETALEGAGTAFVTELRIGSVILCSGQVWSVASITDADSLVINRPASAAVAGIGFTYVNLTNVESLATPVYAPKSTYRPYTEGIELANGRARGFGRPIASWRWGFITSAMRTQLRTFCANKSNDVYIRTRTNEADAYSVFSAVMLWPDDEDKQTGRRLDFEINFRNLVAL